MSTGDLGYVSLNSFWYWISPFFSALSSFIEQKKKQKTKKQMCVCARMLSCIWFFATPWIVAHQAPLSMEFSRQEYWNGLLFSPPENFPDPGIETASALTGRFSTTVLAGKPKENWCLNLIFLLVVRSSNITGASEILFLLLWNASSGLWQGHT